MVGRYENLFIHFPADRYLCCFQFCVIMMKVTINILIQIILLTYVLICEVNKHGIAN